MSALIETAGLRREFGDHVALADVSLSIEEGAVFALVGPNGAGKTTLLRILAALLEPTAGAAVVDGHDAVREPREVHASLGYLPDFYGLYEDMKVRDYLRYFCLAYRILPDAANYRIGRALELVGLPDKSDSVIETLSRGMKQRVGLARTLLHEPKLLLLDEPAAGLDPGARGDLQGLLRNLARQGKTIVVSSHILAELEDYCSHVAILDKGKLVFSGSIAQARTSIGGARRFRVRLAGAPDKAEAVIKAEPAAKLWRREDGGGSFELDGGDEAAARVLKALVSADLPVIAFAEVAGTIQDSYLAMLGRQAR